MSRRRQSKSARWKRRQEADRYVQSARQQGYRSRAAYKLLEIDATARLLTPGLKVADLGAAPGGWSQVAAAKVGDRGRVVAVDKLSMVPLGGVHFIHGDIETAAVQKNIAAYLGGAADVLLSDMAPDLTGIAVTDQARMAALAETVLSFADTGLCQGGHLLIKSFQGELSDRLRQSLTKSFRRVTVLRPAASRRESREFYFCAARFIPPNSRRQAECDKMRI